MPELMETMRLWTNDLLVWIGFGTLVGLLAKAIMPGRDPGGAIATLLMGIGGTIIGCGTLMFFHQGARVSPISPLGFIVAIAGSFILLGFYRLLGGRLIQEGERRPVSRLHTTRHRRHAPEEVVAYED